MQFRRREFLAIAPLGALTTAGLGGGEVFANWCGSPTAHAADIPLSLGYCDGGEATPAQCGHHTAQSAERIEGLRQDSAEALGPDIAARDARALLAGDPQFLHRPAVVRILGMIDRPGASGPSLPSLSVKVMTNPDRGYGHEAWSYEAGTVPWVSSPVEFTVPVDRARGLHLSVDTISATGDRRSTAIVLSHGIGAGAKLRRGLYLLSWGGAQSTDWSRYRIGRSEASKPDRASTGYRIVPRAQEPNALDGAVLAFAVGVA